MCELVSLRWLSMLYLIQESWRDRAVKDEIAIEQLYFLHRLIPLEPRPWRWRRWFNTSIVVFVLRMTMGIRPKSVILVL